MTLGAHHPYIGATSSMNGLYVNYIRVLLYISVIYMSIICVIHMYISMLKTFKTNFVFIFMDLYDVQESSHLSFHMEAGYSSSAKHVHI